ncbi:XRE family transcriptional regulator [Streptomyces sp. NBC_01754]|uniref:XRE family transcriptional regulator n=1 Tax=Streptomyces sp. NBC_01754 TaxID=2975930 RepID=UPI002DD8DA8A|nr:XRE family transcriptional regulator [Streptomyces sp. NBC_01754]WSC92968.1 XRE family transcriptional regulator [Streptomyces sp. NBC_01754]
MTYDRTRFRAAAAQRGDHGFEQVQKRLSVSRATAYRLWTGRGEPRARTAAAVHRAYGLHAHELIERIAL